MDRPADTKCATPQMDWIGRPDLTQRIVDFLRANPYARAWAYHIDSDTACRTAKGTLDKMTKYVFDEDIEFGERYKEDAVKFQRRLRAQLGRYIFKFVLD
ncbi:hypothetical protein SISSUDRAFT_62220 [Sistotremastrum suecicum HHB10207 ss-3]|uniref:Uncharacterized protein n=1 Tax=Sistotremastrum suecicum HHB10207 ss-3 TaxID=1314776 RepID=A0A166BK00_9AGAM|nr:hypothetical protein SISSUDRAFT_62220 [Sistotremastrum suecicum HHB10207 ss-3]